MQLPLLLCLLTFLSQALAHTPHLYRRASIPTPPNDPFYSPPAGWRGASPGDILRTRKVSLAFLSIDRINYKAAYQILYRTTAGYEDEPSHTVTTVIVPHNAKSGQLVNYLAYIDSNGAQCAPSYSMRQGSKFLNDDLLNYQQLLFSTFLNEGWILTIPDYQGPQRAFAAGRLEGRMSLDGIRAALNFGEIGLDKNTSVVTYGYSGGAIASGWTAALQASYAPEINAIGFAMGGTPANVTSTVQSLDKGVFSGLCVAGITGIIYAYQVVQDWFQNHLYPKGNDAIEYARSHCITDIFSRYPFSHVFSDDFFRNGSSILYDPTIQSVISDIVLGLKESETPKAPVYMFHSQHDEIVPFSDARKTSHNWAKHGADVFFQEFSDLPIGHALSEITNIPNSLFFVRDRFAGKPFPKGYTRKVTGNGLEEPNASLAGLGELVRAIQDIQGREVGPADSELKQFILDRN